MNRRNILQAIICAPLVPVSSLIHKMGFEQRYKLVPGHYGTWTLHNASNFTVMLKGEEISPGETMNLSFGKWDGK